MKKASPKNFGKMEVDEEAESKKKLHHLQNELQKQLRRSDEFPDVPPSVVVELKEKWQQEVQYIEQRRNFLLPERQKTQKSLQDNKKQCHKDMAKWVGDREKARHEIQGRHAAVVEQLTTMGAAQSWQQLSALQGELSKRVELQHQPAPATPVHELEGEGGDENEEEQRRRAASRHMGQPAPGRAMRCFRAAYVFDPSKLSRNAGEGDGDEFN